MQDVKTCPYFRTNLGLANTVDTRDGKVLRETDGFQHYYNSLYKTTIFGQGNIGTIMFYIDHYIKDDVLAVYVNNDEFIFPHDPDMIKEKGVNFFLGHILKEVDRQAEERLEKARQEEMNAEDAKAEREQNANADKIFENPGAVSFEDLKAYLDQKNKDRYN